MSSIIIPHIAINSCNLTLWGCKIILVNAKLLILAIGFAAGLLVLAIIALILSALGIINTWG